MFTKIAQTFLTILILMALGSTALLGFYIKMVMASILFHSLFG